MKKCSQQTKLLDSKSDSFSQSFESDDYPYVDNGRMSICSRVRRFGHRSIYLRSIFRKITSRKLNLAIFTLVILLILFYSFSYFSRQYVINLIKTGPPHTVYTCGNPSKSLPHNHHVPLNSSSSKLREDPKVLLFSETQYSKIGKSIAELLSANRIKYKMEVVGKSLPLLTNLSKGKYGVVIFENFNRYLTMDQWNRELLDKYLLEYGVGMIGFVPPKAVPSVGSKLYGFPLYVTANMELVNMSLNANNPVLRLTRAGDTLVGKIPGSDWTIFSSDDPNYVPIESAYSNKFGYTNKLLMTVTLDRGRIDGIRKVLFGGGMYFWLHRLLLLDAISYLSLGRISINLERFILVDIDDIFVGPKGARMTKDDVDALLGSQLRLQKLVPGWRFNLGFSGKYYKNGFEEENEGDEYLLKHVNDFWWFGHMWGHNQPHKFNTSDEIVNIMQKNKQFARTHKIPIDSGYSVAPHHSGVYPIHDPLYYAWKHVWNVRVTSSEEYPHLRPARLRRGFIHRNIMVLPRQTCNLFTHTIFYDKFPGGPAMLEKSIQGGELFQTIVNNPISIFMTHLSNYGNDRLALYTFESVLKFVKCWTNLDMKTVPPLQLGEKYFHMFPEEVEPVWGNPCLDRRHLEIWSANKSCEQLPKFLVIGPQKTGTTALYTFLAMHPTFVPNNPSPETFEEIQFFNGKNYFKGIDWYMKFFPQPPDNNTQRLLFEKSATYFDGELVPRRVKELLPKAKLVTILVPPEKRAYSWYYHMRSHNDVVAQTFSFSDIIRAKDKDPRGLTSLRNRCLNPGTYAKHLERWLDYFPSQQLYIIDGEELRKDPILVMNNLQKFLEIEPFYDYSKHLRYDKRKGFFCQVTEEDKTKCLGRGKGRQYPLMSDEDQDYLRKYYRPHNVALEKLLNKLNYPVPSWLHEELSLS